MLDECTSGLDVHTANSIIGLLKDLSNKPYDNFSNKDSTNALLSVVTTIHQPTSQMWQLFDRVIVMSEGEIVFDINTAEFNEIL